LTPVKAILRRGKRENNGRNKINRGTMYLYVEMSQGNPRYNYDILIKTLKIK
jgi:hypothetical protein